VKRERGVRASRALVFLLAGLVPLGAGWLVARSGPSPPANGRWSPEAIPDVALCTHEGRTVLLHRDLLAGKVVVLNFLYTKCTGVCPKTVRNLCEVQRLLGDRVGRDVFFYSVTLKPEQDSPEVLRAYADAVGAGPGWLFLTGTPADVERVRHGFGFVDPDPDVDTDRSQHIGMVLYGNEARRSWAACPGESNPAVLAEQILWMLPQRGDGDGK